MEGEALTRFREEKHASTSHATHFGGDDDGARGTSLLRAVFEVEQPLLARPPVHVVVGKSVPAPTPQIHAIVYPHIRETGIVKTGVVRRREDSNRSVPKPSFHLLSPLAWVREPPRPLVVPMHLVACPPPHPPKMETWGSSNETRIWARHGPREHPSGHQTDRWVDR